MKIGTRGIAKTRAKLGLVVAKTTKNIPKAPQVKHLRISQQADIVGDDGPPSPHANL